MVKYETGTVPCMFLEDFLSQMEHFLLCFWGKLHGNLQAAKNVNEHDKSYKMNVYGTFNQIDNG